MRILLATNNPSKVARVRDILGARVECVTPQDLGIPIREIEEGSDIERNAEDKARAYLGQTDLPVLGMDTAFVIPGEDLDPARVRRNALGGRDESEMTKTEIADRVIAFYRAIVERRGGPIACHWTDASALVFPDGSVRHAIDERPVILTADVRGAVDPNFPMRSMYTSAKTGKYVADQTAEDQAAEMLPYRQALERIFDL